MLPFSLLFVLSDPSAVEAAGRLDYWVARCDAFGWEADVNERVARFERLVANHPDRSREDLAREFMHGTRYAYSREGEANAAAAASLEAKTHWIDSTEARCDRVAREHPRLLRRTPGTATDWADLLSEEP